MKNFFQEFRDKTVGSYKTSKTCGEGAGYLSRYPTPHHTPHNVSHETLVNIFHTTKCKKR